MAETKILVNKARCKLCGEVLVSAHRHDFRTCHCGAVSVDGGRDYIKRSWRGAGPPEDFIEELSEYESEA